MCRRECIPYSSACVHAMVNMVYAAVWLAVLLPCVLCSYKYEVRGLDPSNKPRYHPGRDFTCLDGTDTVAFSMVNDDYCDCLDGSDEPGTAACPNGGFYCPNTGHRPATILSSRVNDGICDCCDGSDEWWGEVHCENTCVEMGRKEDQARQEREVVYAQGYEKRVQYEQQGIRSREDKVVRREELKLEQEKLKAEVERLREEKEAVEEPERLAKEEHEKKWEEEQAAKKEAERESEMKAAFEQLDTDSDGVLTVAEIQQRMELDDDLDGEVSLEEALAYLGNEESVDLPSFMENVWSFVSDKITFEPPEEETVLVTPPPTEAPLPVDTADDEDFDDYDYDEEGGIDKADEHAEREESMPPYPEETQALIATADTAREAFKQAESQLRDVDREAGELDKFLGMDLGPAMEFAPLYDQCYEYTDREYTYKLCAFNKITQRSKSGGRETSLGNWVSWNGPESDRYSGMLFENGEGCWNGPKRSTRVSVACGLEETVLSAAEPNRCEYALEFVTPAVCQLPTPAPGAHSRGTPNQPDHQEL